MNFRQMIVATLEAIILHDLELARRDRERDEQYYKDCRDDRVDTQKEIDKGVEAGIAKYNKDLAALSFKLREASDALQMARFQTEHTPEAPPEPLAELSPVDYSMSPDDPVS
jgi:hypothetical protein